MSKNQMFRNYLKQQNDIMKKNDPKFTLQGNTEFIIKCRTVWKSMTESEQKVFTIDSDTFGDNPKKTNPNSIDSLLKEDLSIEEALEQNIIDILIKNKSKDEIMKTKIFLMSSNVLCVVDNTYPPLEIGFVEYTIEKGIQKMFHTFTKADEIPVGYAYSAINHSRNVHKIPVNDFVLESDEFGFIGDQIEHMLAESRVTDRTLYKYNYPMIVFSSGEQKHQNVGVLKWLSIKYKNLKNNRENKELFDWNIKVLDVTKLLFNIFTHMGVNRPLPLCVKELNTNIFDYSPDTDCPYHEGIECIGCALGVVRRMAYSLSQSLYRVFMFKVLSTHFPKLQYVRKYSYLEFLDNNPLDKLEIKGTDS